MSIYLSLIVAVAGVVMYFIASNSKVQEIGRIAYHAGLFVFLLQLAPQIIAIFSKH